MCLKIELEGGQESHSGVGLHLVASGPWSLESWLRRWMQKAVRLLSEPRRRACLPAVFILQQGLTLLYRLHVALFYISGSFYHLSKRAADISYVSEIFFIRASNIYNIYINYLSKCACFAIIFSHLKVVRFGRPRKRAKLSGFLFVCFFVTCLL